MRSAGCAVNDVADRDFDRHVKRTAQRPVTSGAVASREALALGAVLALVAFALVLTTNLAAVAVERRRARGHAASIRSASASSRCRRRCSASPSASASRWRSPRSRRRRCRALGAGRCWLLGNLFWVLAYDTEYAMVDRDDDLRIGIRTSAITLGRFDVAAVMAFYALYLAIWARSARGSACGWPYFAGLAPRR